MSASRIAYVNLVKAATVTASSELTSLPVTALLNQLRSDVWRSALGWTIGAENNKIDFDRSGVKVASVASGTYATGADLCVAIVAALEVADATPVWAASYTAGIFQISSDLAFTLKNSTGANKANSIVRDLAWGAVDTASATTQNAPGVSYQSRHWICVDLGAATSFQAGLAINHNFLLGVASVKLQASASTLVGVGLGAAPTVSQSMTVGSDLAYYYFGSVQSYRYLRLLIDDIVNPDGYSELGLWFTGPFLELSRFRVSDEDDSEPLSVVRTAINGANYQLSRPKRRLRTRSLRLTDQADKTALEAFEDAVSIGGNFFVTDNSDDPSKTLYAYLEKGLNFSEVDISRDGPVWDLTMQFRESLG